MLFAAYILHNLYAKCCCSSIAIISTTPSTTPVDNLKSNVVAHKKKTLHFCREIKLIRFRMKSLPTQHVVLWMVCGHHILCVHLLTANQTDRYPSLSRAMIKNLGFTVNVVDFKPQRVFFCALANQWRVRHEVLASFRQNSWSAL